MQQQAISDKLTLPAAIELLNRNDKSPTYLVLRVSGQMNLHDIDAFHRALSINTSVTRVYIYAEKPEEKSEEKIVEKFSEKLAVVSAETASEKTAEKLLEQTAIQLPKSFLDAILDVLKQNILIRDLVFKDCVIPAEFYEQIEEQLEMNNRYADELVEIAKPKIRRVELKIDKREKSFDKKLAEVEEEIKRLSGKSTTNICLYVYLEGMTVAEINLLVELRKRYPNITELEFEVNIRLSENPEQVALAVNNLTVGLSRLRIEIFYSLSEYRPQQFDGKSWEMCTHSFNIGSELRELELPQSIDFTTLKKVANVLQNNQGLQSLSITACEASLTTLSNALRANTSLRSLSLFSRYDYNQVRLNVCVALIAHPTLECLKIEWNNFDRVVLYNIVSLVERNSSLKTLMLLGSIPVHDECFVKLCAALESNTNIRELRVQPSSFTVNCVRALIQLLSKNRTLRVLSFGNGKINASTAAIKELLLNIPLDCHLIDFDMECLIIDDELHDYDIIEIYSSLGHVLTGNRKFINFTFGFVAGDAISDEAKKRIKAQLQAQLENNNNGIEALHLKDSSYFNFKNNRKKRTE